MKSLFIPLLLALATLTSAHTPEEWKSRTIYQLLTDRFAKTDGDTTPCADFSNYCGGTFQGIINNLDYITGMGFDAIWISPIVANMPNNYHGYAAENIYQINPYFGTSDDLKNLVNACHEKDIWVMVDVVANHMGCLTSPNVYADKVPFNDSSYYHVDVDCGNVDTNNETQRETCWLSQLADLDQDVDYVKSTLLSWISDIVSTYNIDGLRIDTVPYVNPSFWTDFTQASGVYTVGEVYNGYLPFCASFQGPVSGILNYPYFYALRSAFQQYNSMYGLQTYFQSATGWPDQTLLGNFVDNHDNARFLNYKGDHTAFKSALAFSLGTVGIPIVYYGSEQAYGGGNDPNNREPLWTNMDTTSEIYVFLQQVISIRKQTQFYLYDQVQRYADDNFYAFTRGNYFFAFTNHGYNLGRTITYHPYADGTVLCNLMYSGDCVTVTSGSFQVDLNNGEVKIYAPKSSDDDKKEEQQIAGLIKEELLSQQTVDDLNRAAEQKIQMIMQEQVEIQASSESEIFKTNAVEFLNGQIDQLTAEIQLRTYQYKGLVPVKNVTVEEEVVKSAEERNNEAVGQVDTREEDEVIEELMREQLMVELSNESEEEKEVERKELGDKIEEVQAEIQTKSLEAIGLVTPVESEDSSDEEIKKFIEEEKKIEASNGQVDVSEEESKIEELMKEQMIVAVSNESEEEKNAELKKISDEIEKEQAEIELRTYQYQGLAMPAVETVQVDTTEEEKATEDLLKALVTIEFGDEDQEIKDAAAEIIGELIEEYQEKIKEKTYGH